MHVFRNLYEVVLVTVIVVGMDIQSTHFFEKFLGAFDCLAELEQSFFWISLAFHLAAVVVGRHLLCFREILGSYGSWAF